MSILTKNKKTNCFRLKLTLLLFSLFFVASFKPCSAATVAWVDGSSTSNWSDGANWSGGAVPTADDDVTISTTSGTLTVNIAAATTVNSLTIGNSGGAGTTNLNFNYNAISSGALVIDSGNLNLYAGSSITHTVGTSSVVGTIYIDVQTGDATVNGTINASYKGYAGANGPGSRPAVGWGESGSGAGHGGVGGTAHLYPGGVAYGSMTEPITCGSGSSGNGSITIGGGAVKLNVAGTLSINNTISADGSSASTSSDTNAPGGASGGSVYIIANSITGSGSISANGGNGRSGKYDRNPGGGGGGRISLNYASSSYTGATSANGGYGITDSGGPGTVFTKEGDSNGTLKYSNPNNDRPETKGITTISDTLTLDNLIIENKANVNVTGTLNVSDTISMSSSAYLTVGSTGTITYTTLDWGSSSIVVDNGGTIPLLDADDLEVPTGSIFYANTPRTYNNLLISGTLSHSGNTSSQTYSIDLTITGDATVSGTVNINGKGFAGPYGSGGAAKSGWAQAAGGAGYGGIGGSSDTSGGTTYGSITEPVSIGSGSISDRHTTYGGGAVKLNVSGTLTLNNTISANGTDGANGGDANYASGGGSGGSIWLIAGSLTGAGNITSNGGSGLKSKSTYSGGGGGGRISINYSSSDYAGTVTANGGASLGNTGGPGSIFTKQTGTNGTLRYSNPNCTTPETKGVNTLSTSLALDNLVIENYSHIILNGAITISDSITLSTSSFLTIGPSADITYSTFDWGTGTSVVDKGGSIALLDGRDFEIPSDRVFYSNVPRTVGNLLVNGTLTHTGNTTSEVSLINLTVNGDATINGPISLNGKGFTGSNGTGKAAKTGWADAAGGAGYGGAGGSSNTAGGITYGSITEPVNIGSGSSSDKHLTSGGGAVKLNVSGTLTINNTISANGTDGANGGDANYASGGGSGGSVWLIANTLAGSGNITASGGKGIKSKTLYSGGGGGGRISINYSTSSYTGTVIVNGGYSPTDSGEVGTIVYSPTSLAQYKSDGSTSLITGDTINNLPLVLQLQMSGSTASATLTPEFEIQAIGTDFSDSPTSTGSAVAYSGTPVTGSLSTTSVLDKTSFHWQTRICDASGICGTWVSYGGNSESAADFITNLNSPPSSPSSLGGTNYVNGSYVSDNTPALQFTLSDPDTDDQVGYQIQIDNNSNFSSPEVDITSSYSNEGDYSYTVTDELSDGSYYWRVKAIDDAGESSSYVNANSGAVAFIVDTTAPSVPGVPATLSSVTDRTPTWEWDESTDSSSGLNTTTPYTFEWCSDENFTGCGSNVAYPTTNSYTHSTSLDNGDWYFRVKASDAVSNTSSYSDLATMSIDLSSPTSLSLDSPGSESYINNNRPVFKWKSATDAETGMASYSIFVDNGDSGDFTISGIQVSGNDSYNTNKYVVNFVGFADSDTSNNYIEFQTKSSSEWSSSENYGELKEGKRKWRVTAYDKAGNYSEAERTLLVDTTNPTLSISSVNGTNFSESLLTTEKTLSISGTVADVLSGDKSDNFVASGYKDVTISIYSKNLLGVYVPYMSSSFSLKESAFSYISSDKLKKDDYKVDVVVSDFAGNSTLSSFYLSITTPSEIIKEVKDKDLDEESLKIDTGKEKNATDGMKITIPVAEKPSEDSDSKIGNFIEKSMDKVVTVMGRVTEKIVESVTSVIANIVSNSAKDNVLAIRGSLISTLEILFGREETTISDVHIAEVGSDYAIITWETNHYSNSKVNYGDSYDYGKTVQSSQKTKHHSLTIENLSSQTTYYYEVMSKGRTYVFDARHEFSTSE